MISGILLCAGESKRMGKEKLLLPFGSNTVIGHVLKQYTNSHLREVIVVVGANRNKLLPHIIKEKHPKLKIAINENYRYGMLSSLQEGIKVAGNSNAYMVGLGDMPLICTEIINHLLLYYRDNKIVQPVYNNIKGKPVIFPSNLRNEILSEDPIGKSPRDIVKKHPDMVELVEIPYKEIIIDMDTIEDYNKIRTLYKEVKRC
ncbi:MAG: nucleotidyltransferase family protein [Synergistetes bacterium]|nr:nucleotidyltransferase family protein [Synergistota bacterium]